MATKLGFDVILLGAPAAGKDTQALILRKKYKMRPVESGKYWRKMAKQKNAVGELLRRTFSKGQAAPVKLMKEFITKQLAAARRNEDLLFIGNPRLKPEAQLLTKLLKQRDRDYLVIGISLPASEVKKRSFKRMRDDQDWKYVENRINMYRLQVAKTLNYFKSQGKLRSVNGHRSINAVAADIQKFINDYQGRQTTRNSEKKRTNSGRSFKSGSKQG